MLEWLFIKRLVEDEDSGEGREVHEDWWACHVPAGASVSPLSSAQNVPC